LKTGALKGLEVGVLKSFQIVGFSGRSLLKRVEES
jgi:hypothetical protein